ncbi:hypothetical protein BJY24_005723 [Nocardia transvalensis]|uniref:Uncharacterized protein n=1 Tax=Nocardia transvalensis TaxID=37333 RepID=A0A7W9PIJ5_9NOCA|nr:hypothetical protein [Nocardia transvalensis]MBB5916811.1 hypothetical protein [Nocardia transvalensis]
MDDDLGIDAAAQDDPAWREWSRPERIAHQVDRLFSETLPAVPTGPGGWTTPAGDPLPPMPAVARYDDAMKLHWLADVFGGFFPDEDSLLVADNADLADQFVCYIGQYFVERCGGRWINDPSLGGMLYEFGPAVAFDYLPPSETAVSPGVHPVHLLFEAAADGDFAVVTDAMYSASASYAEAHGLAHEALQLRGQHDLNA